MSKSKIFVLSFILCPILYSGASLEDIIGPNRSRLSQAIINKHGIPALNLCKQPRIGMQDERQVAFNRRIAAAYRQTLARAAHAIAQEGTDETLVPHFTGQFTKTLEHDAITGLLTPAGIANYKQLLLAVSTGHQQDYNAIVRAPGAPRKLVNPQDSFTFSMQGMDSSLFDLPHPPSLPSAEAAADLIEVYLQAICRSVRFIDYATNPLTIAAAQILQSLGDAYKGPRNADGIVDTSVLFRGNSVGDKVGPYCSQFLVASSYALSPVSDITNVVGPDANGINNLNNPAFEIKMQIPIAQNREFGVTWTDFIALQNGKIPKRYTPSDFAQSPTSPLRRYIINGRDLGTYSHVDTPFEPYYNAIVVLTYAGFPLSKASPYQDGSITNEVPFGSMGVPDAYGLIGGVTSEALKVCWAQKWRAYRKLRPEAMAGLVHYAQTTGTNKFNLHASLFNPELLALILQHNSAQAPFYPGQNVNTYLLSQMYPEASPAHPSYPSGHASIAGACVTVIKAIFEDTTPMKFGKYIRVKANADGSALVPLVNEGENLMTVASELDKFASNISMGRDFAGIHYRSDAELGILLGEEVGIKYLQDQACKYAEQAFTGFVLTRRNGTRIRITSSSVDVIS